MTKVINGMSMKYKLTRCGNKIQTSPEFTSLFPILHFSLVVDEHVDPECCYKTTVGMGGGSEQFIVRLTLYG